MKKAETIKRYGEDAYEKQLEQSRAYYAEHLEQEKARKKKWKERHPEQAKAAIKKWQEQHAEEERARKKRYYEEHPEEVKARSQEASRKGGKRYDRQLIYQQTGIQGDKNKIRGKHRYQYKPYKDIIAPESQIHHEWIPKTAEYRGVALVEANAHRYGFVDVIEILDGKITVLTEEEVKTGKKNRKEAIK